MSFTQYIRQHKRLLPLFISVLFLLLINLCYWLLQTVALPQSMSELTTSTLSIYLLLNSGIILLAALGWFIWRNQRQAFHKALLHDVTAEINQLEAKLELIHSADMPPAERLQYITQRINFMLKRDHEIRHMVRVQGLIDHELAIGNRVFFESKLQHYLTDEQELESGALYIIQLHNTESGYGRIKQLQQLRCCVDILQGVGSDYADAVLARLSDNDLALLVAGITNNDMAKLGDRIASLLSRASCFADLAEQEVLNIGYAAYQRGQTSYQILSEADMALKTAQLQGPNTAYGFVRDGKPQAKGSVWWRSELTRALQENRFSLSFQPVFSWQDSDIIQHEVIIRLQSGDNDDIPAAIFLPMAHNCGLASQIDRYVIRKAARLCAADSRTYSRCSVNISVQSLLDTQWWDWLEHMLLSAQLEPQQLALEIGEHHLLKYYSELKHRLIKLHKSGFSLIIDQVGLLIDNALYVEQLPLESVKLHPSVVRNIDKHIEQQLFVRGLIAGYAAKGVRVIATGVESEQEWQALQNLGVAGGQGVYFSHALSQIIA